MKRAINWLNLTFNRLTLSKLQKKLSRILIHQWRSAMFIPKLMGWLPIPMSLLPIGGWHLPRFKKTFHWTRNANEASSEFHPPPLALILVNQMDKTYDIYTCDSQHKRERERERERALFRRRALLEEFLIVVFA